MSRHLCLMGLASVAVLLVSAGTARSAEFPDPLRGTKRLVLERPLDELMVDGINVFAERQLERSVAERARHWHRDFSNPVAYEKSIAANRERLKTIIGAVDPRVAPTDFELITSTTVPSKRAEAKSYTVHAVRWQVLPGVTAEGLLLQPRGTLKGHVIALPDADWTPESFAGLMGGVDASSQIPRRLAENGLQVVVPTLINRSDTWSGNPAIRMTNQPHREFIYRMGFELGRHIIGYEVQKVLAAVDLFSRLDKSSGRSLPIGVVGVSEGGLIAFYSAAVDPRIQSAWISGYFGPREKMWREPIYRNVWSLLTEFGDAEIASLIVPGSLVIEAARVPEISGPPMPHGGQQRRCSGRDPHGSSRRRPTRVHTADETRPRRDAPYDTRGKRWATTAGEQRCLDALPAGVRVRQSSCYRGRSSAAARAAGGS